MRSSIFTLIPSLWFAEAASLMASMPRTETATRTGRGWSAGTRKRKHARAFSRAMGRRLRRGR